jgi:hypothetical protein
MRWVLELPRGLLWWCIIVAVFGMVLVVIAIACCDVGLAYQQHALQGCLPLLSTKC